AVEDVNGDAKPDLIVPNAHSDTVSVLLGNGNGIFQNQITYATGSFPNAVKMADLNGDGKPDIVVGNVRDDSVSVLLGNGDGTFQDQTSFAGGGYNMAVGDMNSDGKLDLVTANATLLLASGNGDFTGQVYTVASAPTGKLAFQQAPAAGIAGQP